MINGKDCTTLDIASGTRSLWMSKQQLPKQFPRSDAKLHCIKQPFTPHLNLTRLCPSPNHLSGSYCLLSGTRRLWMPKQKQLPRQFPPLEVWKTVIGEVKECRLAASITHSVSESRDPVSDSVVEDLSLSPCCC